MPSCEVDVDVGDRLAALEAEAGRRGARTPGGRAARAATGWAPARVVVSRSSSSGWRTSSPRSRRRSRRSTRTRIGGAPVRRRSAAPPIWPPAMIRSAVAATTRRIGVRGARAPPASATKRQPGLAAQAIRRRRSSSPGTSQRDRAHRRAQRVQPRRRRRPTMRMPTGVRTPVAIMSMRARAGAVQRVASSRAGAPPDRAPRSAPPSSAGVSSGHSERSSALQRARRPARVPARRARRFGHCVARLEPDGRLRHRERRRIGGGVGAARPCRTPSPPPRSSRDRPVLPARAASPACSGGTPGVVVGMKSRSPSSMRGRNSPPRRRAIGRHEITASAAVTSVNVGRVEREVDERAVDAHQPRASAGSRTRARSAPREQPRAQRGRDRQRDQRGRRRSPASWSAPAGAAAGRSRRRTRTRAGTRARR